MDDCPFLTPRQLGLTSKERDALIMTLILMEHGMVHPAGPATPKKKIPEGRYPFNMSIYAGSYQCGTIACIAGTAEIVGKLRHSSLGNKSVFQNLNGKSHLYELFYGYFGGNVNPDGAAKVLRHYLATGKTEWSKSWE